MRTRWITAVFFCLTLAACGGGGGGGGGGNNEPPASAPPQQPVAPATNPPRPEPPPETEADTDVTEITLLALYTSGVEAQFVDPDLRIQHLVSVANDVLSQSGVALRFVLDHVEWVDYPDQHPVTQALDDLTFGTHASVAHVAALRDQTAADLVVLVRPYANDGYCGYAWIGGYQTDGDFSNQAEADFGYSVAAGNCSDYTLLHELGHNLGLAHSRREDPAGGTFGYALGYGMDSSFTTVMASPDEFGAPQLPRLSSPLLDCNGEPCGVDHANADSGADAVRTLNITKTQVAAYR